MTQVDYLTLMRDSGQLPGLHEGRGAVTMVVHSPLANPVLIPGKGKAR